MYDEIDGVKKSKYSERFEQWPRVAFNSVQDRIWTMTDRARNTLAGGHQNRETAAQRQR